MFGARMKNNMQSVKDKIIQPAFNLFYSMSVATNILFNPVKLIVTANLYFYWKSVSERTGLSFITTNLDGRYYDTEKILKAIELPNQAFLQVVDNVIHGMQDGELKVRLLCALKQIEDNSEMNVVRFFTHAGYLASNLIFSSVLGQFNAGYGAGAFLLLEAVHAVLFAKAISDSLIEQPRQWRP